MRKISLFIICFFIIHNLSFSQKINNNELSLPPDKVEWFKEAKFGMFVHWGLYSILGGTYKSHTLPDTTLANGKSYYAEWIQKRLEVPSYVYKNLAKKFNPTKFNADKWISEAKNQGIKYFVITAKHHDGFALWNTKFSNFKITNTPYKKDILKQLVTACKKYGVKYGFYYSHWQDWEYPGGALPYWEKRVKDSEFQKYWEKKALPQIKELINKFDPDLLWFDTWDEVSHITDARRDELIALVRKNSSKCLINGRISFYNPGENIDYLEMHDNQYPPKILDKPWQTPATMNRSWGWHAKEYNWNPSKQMIEYLVNNVSKGGNYLLNIGPKPDGTFPKAAVRRLREMGAWMSSNSDCIYGSSPVNLKSPKNVYLTQKKGDKNQYLYVIITKPMDNVVIPIHIHNLINCEELETNQPIVFKKYGKKGNKVQFTIPKNVYKQNSIYVLRVEIKEKI